MKFCNMNVLMSILLISILILVIKCFISNKTKEGFVYSRCAVNPGGAWSGPNSDGLYYKYYSSNKKKDAAYATLCLPAEKKLRDSQAAAAPDTSSTGLTDSQARSYLAKYPDLQNAFGSDLEQAKSHWISNGKGEGRTWESAGVPAAAVAGNGCIPHDTAGKGYEVVTCDSPTNPWPVLARKVSCTNNAAGGNSIGWSLKTRSSKAPERKKQCLDKGGIGKDTSGTQSDLIRKSRLGEISAKDNDGWVKDVNDENRWKCDEYSNNNNFCKDHRCSIEPDQNTYENKWERCGDNGEWCTKRSQGGLTDSNKRKTACITTKNFSDEDRMNKSESVGWMCTAEGKNWLGNTSICKSHKCNTDPTDYDKDRNIWKICDTDKYCTRTIQKQKIDSDKREEACKQATQAKLAGGIPDTLSTGLTDAQARSYLAKYPDLQKAFGTEGIAAAKSHWISHGKGEGRTWESAGVPGASSTGLSPNDCSCNDEDIKKNIKDIMSNAQEKLKIDIASGTFTCVASNGITPATCPWDK